MLQNGGMDREKNGMDCLLTVRTGGLNGERMDVTKYVGVTCVLR